MKTAFGKRLTPEFIMRLQSMQSRFNWTGEHVNWLIACMAFETGSSFSPAAKNPSSSATGLIQFMDATAQHLGTTTAALRKMTAVEQLDYVEKYFKPYASRIKTLEDMYMAILWPAAIGLPNDAVLWKQSSKWYNANKGLDPKKRGFITKEMAAANVRDRLVYGLKYESTVDKETKPMNVFSFLTVLKQGYALRNASTWKNVNVATAIMTSLLTALSGLAVSMGWLPAEISDAAIMQVSSFTVSFISMFLGYLGIATDETVGVK